MRKIKLGLGLKLSCVMFLLPINSFAADSNSKDSNAAKSFLSSDFFSLSKKKENAFDTPSATYVLSSEDIRRSGMTSIPESLRLIPGMQVSRIDGNKWAISVRGFDRQYANKLLVMIDGRIIYNSVFSGVFWDSQDYVMEDIDRIEVVRGPGGTIWGANAMNGIINIITKSASQTQGTYLSQTFGTSDRSITEARYGGKTESLDSYRVYAKHALRSGSVDPATKGKNDDGITQDRAGFRYDITSIKDSSISIHGDINHDNAQNYFSSFPPSNIAYRNDKLNSGGNLSANWNKTLSKQSSFTLQTYYDYSKFETPVMQIYEKTLDVDFQHFYSFSKENQFSWGLGYKDTSNSVQENLVNSQATAAYYPLQYLPSSRNVTVYSAFLQDKIGIIADKLYLTIGSKFMNNSLTGFEYQPSARLTYYPARNQTLWTSVSRAVRTPTYGERALQLNANGTIIAQQGTNTYSSEDVISYEMGYRIKPTEKTMVDLATFYNQYSNLRTFDGSGAKIIPGYAPTGTPTAGNNGSGTTYGFELNGKWQVLDIWRLEASYDMLHMDLAVNGASTDNQQPLNTDPLQRSTGFSPRNQFRIRSLLNLTPKLEFDNMLFYTSALNTAGNNAAINATTGNTTYGTGIKPYTRWDTRLGYLVNRNLDVSFGVQNILNHYHQEFKSGLFSSANGAELARTYYVKAVLRF
jgi:iron complex outermembrane receptor protein